MGPNGPKKLALRQNEAVGSEKNLKSIQYRVNKRQLPCILVLRGQCVIWLKPPTINLSKRSSQPNSASQVRDASDQDDFEAIFARHRLALRHFLLGVLKDESLVQDALQSTFIKLIEKGDTVENHAAMKSWLLRVGYNEAMQVRRKQATATKHLEKFAWQVDWVGRETSDPDAQILQRELQSQVADALQQLSPEQYEVVEKRIYQGLKFREIAEELDVPLGTVLARMHSSLKKLKSVLDHFHKDG